MTISYRPKTLLVVALAVVLVLTVGCSGNGSDGGSDDRGNGGKPPTTDPDIRGSITTLSDTGGRVSILVEGVVEEDTEFDKASVTLLDDVSVFDADDNAVSVDDLAEGQRVEVWFTGPVAESYPVQATGEAVRIIEK